MKRWHHRARHALAHSLRVRLVALFVLLAVAMSAIFLGGMQYALSIGWRDAARPLLMDYVDKLAAEVGSPPRVDQAQALVDRLPLRVTITGPVVNWRSHSNQPHFPQNRDDPSHSNLEDHWLERKTADGHRIEFALSATAWGNRPRSVGWVTLALLLLFTAMAYRKVRGLLRPLDDIRAGALRFGAGDFAQPIGVRHAHHPDELGELAGTINTMAADIAQMLDAKRSLLLAISHELRSPLTRARLNTELLPETEELRASREALLRDLAVMRDLVTDLLESERLSDRHAALHCERVELKALAQEVVSGLGQAVQQDIADDLPVLYLDPTRIRLLLRNLMDNALRHSVDSSQPPLLGLRATEQGGVEISVRDFGSGVPPDQLHKLAQAFYRPDAARTRDDGGVGLGLYLCKLVALAHGGKFTIANASPGLVITVTLPPSISGNSA
jgi:signal transduction histidine kinase